MDDLVIGTDPLDFQVLNRAMQLSPSFGTLVQKWATLANNLGVDYAKVEDWKMQLQIGKIQPDEIPSVILRTWRAEKGRSATFRIFGNALVQSGMTDIAETVREMFEIRISIHGNILTLRNLLEGNISLYKEVYMMLVQNLNRVPELPVKLFREELAPSERKEYYIPRTLSYRTEIDRNIFFAESTVSHAFVVKGISKHELATITDFQPIDTSGNQLDELTVRFVILEWDEDYEQICEQANNPVHLLEFKGESFFWVKSNQSLGAIVEFF